VPTLWRPSPPMAVHGKAWALDAGLSNIAPEDE
jgi:hypothetical protein